MISSQIINYSYMGSELVFRVDKCGSLGYRDYLYTRRVWYWWRELVSEHLRVKEVSCEGNTSHKMKM